MTTMVKDITPENVSVVPDPTSAIIVRQEKLMHGPDLILKIESKSKH